MIGSDPTVANILAKTFIKLFKLPFYGMTKAIGVAYTGTLYSVSRFPFTASIQGQTWGDYVFLRRDIGSLSARGMSIIRHELKHVEQYHRLGFWGLGFLLTYAFQFIVCTRCLPSRISYAIKNLPLEKEAYDFQVKRIV